MKPRPTTLHETGWRDASAPRNDAERKRSGELRRRIEEYLGAGHGL
jgi:hypothetical protein